MSRNSSQTVAAVKTLATRCTGAGSSKDFLVVTAACNKVIYKYIHVQCIGEFIVDVQQHDRIQPLETSWLSAGSSVHAL